MFQTTYQQTYVHGSQNNTSMKSQQCRNKKVTSRRPDGDCKGSLMENKSAFLNSFKGMSGSFWILMIGACYRRNMIFSSEEKNVK